MILYFITVIVIFNHFLLGMLLIFAPKITNLPNKLLAGQLLSVGAVHFITLFYYYPYADVYSHLFGLDYAIGACMGPFIYLYTYSYLRGTIPKGRHNSHHFFIPLIFLSLYIFGYLLDYQHDLIDNSRLISQIQTIADPFVFAQGSIYILLAFLLYRKALNRPNSKKKAQLKWLKMYFGSTFVFVISVIPLGLINNGRLTGMYIALFSLFYFIVLIWQSLSSSKIFGSESTALEAHLNDFSKEATELMEIIENRRLYANKDLTLELLACQLEIGKQQITSIFHSHIGLSFNDYINKLRINEAKIKLLDPQFHNFTIEAIGLEAGFGSRSTFYELFKSHTGLTPTEFKQQRKIISS